MVGPKSGGAAGINTKPAPGSITLAPRLPRSTLRKGRCPATRFSAALVANFPTPLMLCGPPNGLTNLYIHTVYYSDADCPLWEHPLLDISFAKR